MLALPLQCRVQTLLPVDVYPGTPSSDYLGTVVLILITTINTGEVLVVVIWPLLRVQESQSPTRR